MLLPIYPYFLIYAQEFSYLAGIDVRYYSFYEELLKTFNCLGLRDKTA